MPTTNTVNRSVRGLRPDKDVLDDALAAARDRGTVGFTALYRTLAGDIAAFCRARGVTEVDDLVNDVFLGAFRGLAGFDGDGSAFRAYVYRIARNKIVDERRRIAAIARHLTDDADLAETPAVDSQSTELVALDRLDAEAARALLGLLTEDQREVILLRFLAGLSIAEVVSVTGRSVTSVKSLQRRALATLRRKLSRSGGIADEHSKDTCG